MDRPLHPILVLGAALTLALLSGCVRRADPLVATTAEGQVRGAAEGTVIAFRGIAFAQPPVGELRWRAPQPVGTWQGVQDATAFKPDCAQPGEPASSEDCLYLNVFRPAAEGPRPHPVMVWIYGGSNLFGGASRYPGEGLARQGVVVVTFNYRLGRLGFFAHPALAAGLPADEPTVNYAHLDMVAALQWVRRNIRAFGGDPDNVTVFGESAGGGGVLTLLTQDLAPGLFHKAIVQSAGVPTSRGPLIGYSDLAAAEATARRFARDSLGIDGDDATAASVLRRVPAARFVDDVDPRRATLALVGAAEPVPGVAGASLDGRIVKRDTESVLRAGRQAQVPLMVGATDLDLALGAAADKSALFAAFGSLAAEAQRVYDRDGDRPLAALTHAVFADRGYIEPARFHADQHARAGLPTWLYRFAYVPEALRATLPGAPHASDVPFVFGAPEAFAVGAPGTVGPAATSADRAAARTISRYWVNFARTGDPNGRTAQPVWKRHVVGSGRIMQFGNEGPAFGEDPLAARLDLWERYWAQRGAGL